MKRTVIDTNCLKSDELKEYLSDPSNVAVIPDFAVLETLKAGDANGISDQLAACADRAPHLGHCAEHVIVYFFHSYVPTRSVRVKEFLRNSIATPPPSQDTGSRPNRS